MKSCMARALGTRSVPFEVRRAEPGTYDEHGRWQKQKAETFVVRGSIQPMSPKEILREVDSRHVKEAIKIYTTTQLRPVCVSDKTQPDVVVFGGVEYEVESVADWTKFFKVIAIRREQ